MNLLFNLARNSLMSPKIRNILAWVLSILLALGFVAGAFMKFSGKMDDAFLAWGYPAWGPSLVAIIELIGAALLLIPKTRKIGAILIICIMLGAIGTHLSGGEPFSHWLPALLHGITAGVILMLHTNRVEEVLNV